MKKVNPKYQPQKKKNNVIIPEKKNSSILFIIIAFCIPVLLYLQTIKFGFTHFDDDGIIINNITFLSNFGNAPHAFLTDAFMGNSVPYYRALQTLSYMVDIQLSGGNNTWMFHLSNILLLGLIACSLFLLLRRLLIPQKLALLGALIYCTHPLFVSSIAWIPARGDILLTLFSVLSFLFLIDFLQKEKKIYLFFHWFAFTIALFCKETAALLPLLFILYYFMFSTKKRFEKKYLFIIALYAVSGIFWLWLRSKAIVDISNRNDFGFIPVLLNLQTIPESLSKFFLLFGIAPIPGFSILKTLAGFGIIVLIIIIFFRNNERSKKENIFCFSWFLILMLPPMLYKSNHMDYLDHRFFLPLLGILIFLLFIFPKKWLRKGDIKSPWLLVVIIVILCSFTFIKSRSYSDPITFWNSAASQNPKSVLAYYNRGNLKMGRNDIQGALEDYNKAISLNSNFEEVYYNRGNIKSSLRDFQGAIDDFNKAIAVNPNFPEAYANRGVAETNTGNITGALEDYNKAITINPKYDQAYYDRGCLKLNNMGDKPGAIADFNIAISINNNYAYAWCNRGIANMSSGKFKEAIADYNKTISINPDCTEAYYNRGFTKANMGDIAGAIEDYNKVIAISPAYFLAYLNRGNIKVTKGDFQGAIKDYNKVIEINPNYLDAYINRAIANCSLKDYTGAIDDCERVLKTNPDNEKALNLKANIQQELKKINH